MNKKLMSAEEQARYCMMSVGLTDLGCRADVRQAHFTSDIRFEMWLRTDGLGDYDLRDGDRFVSVDMGDVITWVREDGEKVKLSRNIWEPLREGGFIRYMDRDEAVGRWVRMVHFPQDGGVIINPIEGPLGKYADEKEAKNNA